MPGRYRKAAVGCVLLLGAIALPLGGCQTIERETGLNRSTQTGALGGAAFGGIIAALAGANPAWIAASTILGGVTGGAIGNYLSRGDAEKHAQSNLGALDGLGRGQTSRWSNAQSGNSGSTTVTSVNTRADGTVCKAFKETVVTKAETVTKEGTACRAPGGTWRVQA
jgi:surface antigen